MAEMALPRIMPRMGTGRVVHRETRPGGVGGVRDVG